jgi:hypothetical protein
MKKTALILLGLSSFSIASEFQYGNGTFSMEGGFLGLTDSISTDISSYSLVQRHSNIGDFFYGYDLIWYDSDVMKQGQHTYNSMFPNSSPLSIPNMEHRFKGLDANLRVGYDVINENEDNFLGVGILVGLSIPTIEEYSLKNNSDQKLRKSSDPVNSNELMVESKTEIKTYKIGPTISFQKSFNKKVSIYGTGSYAYQTGEIKNSYADAKYTVDGTFQEYNLGLYFTPFTETYKWGWLTLSPRIYATLGYKYANWDVDEMAINLSGNEMSSEFLDIFATDFSMDTSIGYFGLGYSF